MTEPFTPPDSADPALARVERLALRARLALVWERAWPEALGLALVGAAFVFAAWLGLFVEFARPGRIGALALFALAGLYALYRLARIAWSPSRAEAIARIDRDSGKAHRPAATLDDTLANTGSDPATAALWRLHRERAARVVAKLKVAAPSPRMVARDRYALRAAALVAVVGAGFIAGPEKYARLAAAFDFRTAGAISAGYRLDVWLDPPAYTGRPPVLLNARGDDAGEGAAKRQLAQAPVNSTLVARATGGGIELEAVGALVPDSGKGDGKQAAQLDARAVAKVDLADGDARFVLKGPAQFIVKRYGKVLSSFDLDTIADRAPVISLTEDPKPNLRGSLTLSYKIEDDYGVIGAEANFERPTLNGKALKGRSLVEPPKMALGLPQGAGGLGEGQTTMDLSEHAWAGARVLMTLSAKDEGGNEGKSASTELTLPQRGFTKPVARVLVEQRRNLILSPDDNRVRVQAALDAMLIEPDLFKTEAPVFLGLTIASNRLKKAKSDADLLDLAQFMWEMALRIEDGDTSQTERDLRAAQQALREALQRGAPDEEIRKLTENLQRLMDKFIAEMMQRQRDEQGERSARNERNPDRNTRFITPDDLKKLMDRMQEAARNGDMAEAQRMLDQLQALMENLRTARRERRDNSAAREARKMMDELDKMTREEQELRDKTFRQGKEKPGKDGKKQQQGQRGQKGQKGQPGEQGQQGEQGDQGDEDGDQQSADSGDGDESMEGLQERQKSLRERLENLKKRMKQLGAKGEKGLDDAEDAMKEAEGELGKGQGGKGKAVDAQGRALEGLRQGMQGMQQQMAQQRGQGQGQGEGEGDGDPDDYADGDDDGPRDGQPRQGSGNPRDPLDRPSQFNKDRQRGGILSGEAAAQRAYKVLEELRRRLGDPTRPREELDYLERLMRRF